MLKRSIEHLPLILAITLLLVTVVHAHGGDGNLIHSCVDQNGRIRIVAATATCSQKETALDWNIQGPPGPQGPPGTGGSQFMVVDSEQRELGIMRDQNQVAHFVDPYWVTFFVTPNEIFQYSGDGFFQLFFESNDCSGTPYVLSNGILRTGYTSGTKVFYPADPYQVRSFYASQRAKWGVEPVNPEPCESYLWSAMSGPVGQFDISEFTPPVTIRAEP